MRTASEIFEEKAYYNKWMKELTDTKKSLILTIINESQKEGIEESAERAKVKAEKCATGYKKTSCTPLLRKAVVDKQSILSLINELK